jgi:hypothetical protein
MPAVTPEKPKPGYDKEPKRVVGEKAMLRKRREDVSAFFLLFFTKPRIESGFERSRSNLPA